MTEIEDISDYVQGESLQIDVTVHDDSDEPYDLTGADVLWGLYQTRGEPVENALIDADDPGVSVAITDAQNGELRVSIEKGLTETLSGRCWQRLTIDDDSGGRQIYRGHFTIGRA